MMQLAEHLAESQGVVAACATLGLPRSSLYRARPSANVPDVLPDSAEPAVRPAPPRALSQAEQELVCKPCRLAYPIRDDIPVMLADEARQLADEA